MECYEWLEIIQMVEDYATKIEKNLQYIIWDTVILNQAID